MRWKLSGQAGERVDAKRLAILGNQKMASMPVKVADSISLVVRRGPEIWEARNVLRCAQLQSGGFPNRAFERGDL